MFQTDGLPNQGERSMPLHDKDPGKQTLRILVTGGAGYIGSHSVRHFLSRGHEVWVFDNLSEGHRAAVPSDRLIVADLAEIPRLDHVVLEHRIEAVVHFAAFAYVGHSVRE